MDAIDTKSFKSGNSVAVRFPRGTGLEPDVELSIIREGEEYRLKPRRDVAAERRKIENLIERLLAIGPPNEGIPRQPIEFPERPGLLD